jgi:hypothetical protein
MKPAHKLAWQKLPTAFPVEDRNLVKVSTEKDTQTYLRFRKRAHVFLRDLVNLDPYIFTDDLAKHFIGHDENN